MGIPLEMLGHQPGFVPHLIDHEILNLVRKLNELPGVETLFSCAGYGLNDQGESHTRRSLCHAYIYLRYKKLTPPVLALHEKLLRICDTVDAAEHGYVFRPWRAFLHEGSFAPSEGQIYRLNTKNQRRLIHDRSYYLDRLDYVRQAWRKMERAVDEALRCGSSRPAGRRRSTGSSSGAPAAASSGTGRIAGMRVVPAAAAKRTSGR
jgi:hypothetical protein